MNSVSVTTESVIFNDSADPGYPSTVGGAVQKALGWLSMSERYLSTLSPEAVEVNAMGRHEAEQGRLRLELFELRAQRAVALKTQKSIDAQLLSGRFEAELRALAPDDALRIVMQPAEQMLDSIHREHELERLLTKSAQRKAAWHLATAAALVAVAVLLTHLGAA